MRHIDAIVELIDRVLADNDRARREWAEEKN